MSSHAQRNTGQEMLHADSNQYLTFMLNSEEYAVEILRVQGIQGWDNVTPIPNSPQYVLGVMNLRGAIVPIIDLRKRFNMPGIEFGPTTVIIVVRVENGSKSQVIGMVVDAVSEVYRLDDGMIQDLPDFSSAVNSDFIKGLSTVDDKMLILLDVDKLLSIRDINGNQGKGSAVAAA